MARAATREYLGPMAPPRGRGVSVKRRGETIAVPPTTSPLGLVTHEPLVNDLVAYLDGMRRRIDQAPDGRHTFVFSRSNLVDVRKAFARMIRHGEERLHRLCELLAETFFDSNYTLQSVVIGEVETTRERFTLVQNLSSAD